MTASSGNRMVTAHTEERLSLMASAATSETNPLRPLNAPRRFDAASFPLPTERVTEGTLGTGVVVCAAGPAARGMVEALMGVVTGITSRSGRAGG